MSLHNFLLIHLRNITSRTVRSLNRRRQKLHVYVKKILCLQLGADCKAILKTCVACFTGVSKHSPQAFISYLVSGNPGETLLALVFEILPNQRKRELPQCW